MGRYRAADYTIKLLGSEALGWQSKDKASVSAMTHLL